MKAVAGSAVLNQAVADLSADAASFLRAVHDGEIDDARMTADIHLHRLREFARRTGAALDELPAYQANTTNWRAVARLAGSVVDTRTKAG